MIMGHTNYENSDFQQNSAKKMAASRSSWIPFQTKSNASEIFTQYTCVPNLKRKSQKMKSLLRGDGQKVLVLHSKWPQSAILDRISDKIELIRDIHATYLCTKFEKKILKN